MDLAVPINGAKSVMWVERFRDAGEFEIVAPVSAGFRQTLPIGSFISHVDTKEIMVVENHEISDNKEGLSEITVSGRSFVTMLEHRIVGGSIDYGGVNGAVINEYELPSNQIWAQAKQLLLDHTEFSTAYDANDAWVNSDVDHEIVDESHDYPNEVARVVKRESVYKELMDLLQLGNLGVKTVRPGPWSPYTGVTTIVYDGIDRTNQVVFSYGFGEISDAKYFWTNKKRKTSAIVIGKWLQTVVHEPGESYSRRTMIVDAKDIDENFEALPTGTDRTTVVSRMQARGIQALASQVDIAVSSAEISRESTRYAYRQDYNLGDIVAVEGNYDEQTVAQVTEFVEIEDENGTTQYPTLSGL
jgi:hypothetical protein